MPEIKNTFLKGRMNKDLDERLIPNGEYKDALNIEVSTSEGSEVGTVQTILGNTRVDSIVPAGIGESFRCVGSISDEKTNKLYWFVKSDPTSTQAIVEYDLENGAENLVFVDRKANTDQPVLRFPNKIITGINIIDNLLFWTDGNSEPKKINIDRSKQGTSDISTHTKLIVDGVDVGDVEEENITVIKKKPTKAPITKTVFTSTYVASSGIPSLFEKTFSRFSYRYKYEDGEYSAFGPFSDVVFNPEYVENLHERNDSGVYTRYSKETSYNTKEPFNATMVNKIDKIEIYDFIPPSIPKDVVEVELLYKQEDSPVVYSIAKLNVNDNITTDGFNEDSVFSGSGYKGKYEIITENIHAALPENQFIRVFDTVPKTALAQEITGNRIVYGNYTQNYTLEQDVSIDIEYEERINKLSFDNSPLRSLKSLRNYQVGVVFGDKYGRETPVFTSANSATKLSWADNNADNNASRSLSLKATIDNNFNYPTWADYFKFYIKETSTDYYNLIMDKAYVPTADDDERNTPSSHVWISLFSSDRNKVQEDDFLILKNIIKDNWTSQVEHDNKFKVIDIKNEAPESIKYDYNILGLISNTGTAKMITRATGTSDNLMQTSGKKISDDTNMLVLDENVWYAVDGTHLKFTDTGLHEDSLFVSWYDSNIKQYSKRYKLRDIRTNSQKIYAKLSENISSIDRDLAKTNSVGTVGALTTVGPNIIFQIEQKTPRPIDQYSGRFFVKLAFDFLVSEAQGSNLQSLSNALTTTASTNIKYWRNNTSSTSFDHTQYLTHYAGLGSASSVAATGNIRLDNTITNSESDWDALKTAHTGFFIDSMYLCAVQNQSSNSLARHARDLIRGMSGANSAGGTSYATMTWSDTLDTPEPNPFIYSIYLGPQNQPGPNITKNYMDYAAIHTYAQSGKVGRIGHHTSGTIVRGGGTGVGRVIPTTQYGHALPTPYQNYGATVTYGNIGGVFNQYANVQPNPPTWRWKPFAKDANSAGGYEWIAYGDGSVEPPYSYDDSENQVIVLKTHPNPYIPSTVGGVGATQNASLSFPSGSWADMPKPMSLGQNGLIYGQRIVNGLEGVVLTNTNHTYGSRAWGYSLGSPITLVKDSTYGDQGDEGRVYMHLSFLAPGQDLVPHTLDLSGATITGPNCIGAYLQGIHGGGIFTKDAKDAADNGADFGSDWDSPRIIECETSSNNTANIDIGYDQNYQTRHDDQWKPTKASGLSATQEAEINNFIQNINTPNARFTFSTDTNNVIYTIKSVRTKRVYNHTPWRRRYVVDQSELGNTFTDPYGLNGKMVPGGDSVEEAAVAWAKAKEANNITTEQTDLEDKIRAFGKSSNRRLVYIIELDKNPTDTGNYNFIDGSEITAASTASMQFVNPVPGYVSGNVSHIPAIWETEPKKNTGLDIYYETNSAIPTVINDKTRELFAPVGCRVEVMGNNAARRGDYTIPNVFLSLWRTNSNGEQVVRVSWATQGSGFNLRDSDGNNISYTNNILQFIRDDGSYTTAKILSMGSAGTNTVREFIVSPTPYGINGLSWYNCFSLGNGIESNRIRDDFNQMKITNGARASSTLEIPYKEEHRKNGLIYSGIYNSTSNINNLNQFIIGEKITKDLNPTYGSIQKLFQRRVSLVAFCQDRIVNITSNKDALFNADGTPQLISSSNVLGDATPFSGNFGISNNPESFASESYRAYFTDKQRGAVLRLSKDGLTPISSAGMHDYFRDELILSRSLVGTYDAYSQNYNLTLVQSPSTYNLIKNSYLDIGVESVTTPGVEQLRNTTFADLTQTNYPATLQWQSDNDFSNPGYTPGSGTPTVTNTGGKIGLINQDLTTRVWITEYTEIPQGHFQTADNSGAGSPGSGNPGDPGISYVAGTPPQYSSAETKMIDGGNLGSATGTTWSDNIFSPNNNITTVGTGSSTHGYWYFRRIINGVNISYQDTNNPSIRSGSDLNDSIYLRDGYRDMRFYKLSNWANSSIECILQNQTGLATASPTPLEHVTQTTNTISPPPPSYTTDLTVYSGEIIRFYLRVMPRFQSGTDPWDLGSQISTISPTNNYAVGNGFLNGWPNTPSMTGYFQVKIELLDEAGNLVDNSVIDSSTNWTDEFTTTNGTYNTNYTGLTGGRWTSYATSNTFLGAPGQTNIWGGSTLIARAGDARMHVYWKFKDWVDTTTSQTSTPSSPHQALTGSQNIAVRKLRFKITFLPSSGSNLLMLFDQNIFDVKKMNPKSQLGTIGTNYSTPVPAIPPIPAATVPAWTSVGKTKNNWYAHYASPNLTWHNINLYLNTVTQFGPQVSRLYDSAVAHDGSGTYHWASGPANTNNVISYQTGYNPSDVYRIINPPTPTQSLTSNAASLGNFTEPNGPGHSIYVPDKIRVNVAGMTAATYFEQTLVNPLVVGNWYLVDVVLETGTTPTSGSMIIIDGMLPHNPNFAYGLSPDDPGYPDGYFGRLVGTNRDNIWLQPIDRYTNDPSAGGMGYGIRGADFIYEPNKEANVLRAIFKVDPAGNVASWGANYLGKLELKFWDFDGFIEGIRLIDITTDINGDYPIVGTVSAGTGGFKLQGNTGTWVGFTNNPRGNMHSNYIKHLLSPMTSYIGSNGNVNFDSTAAHYGIMRGTGGWGSAWSTGIHRAFYCLFDSPSWTSNNAHTVDDEVPPPSYAGYELTFEIGNNELTGTHSGRQNFTGVYMEDGTTTNDGYGFRINNIDMPGIYKAWVNFGNNTTFDNGENPQLKIDINDGNGFVDPAVAGSAATLSENEYWSEAIGNWPVFYGSMMIGNQGSYPTTATNPAVYQNCIKSISLVDRTNYITGGSGSIGSWNAYNQDNSVQNLIRWSNGTIEINSPKTNPISPPSWAAGLVVYMAQNIDENLVTGHKYRFSFDYTELPNSAAGLILYYYNLQGKGFVVNINPGGSGTYSQVHTIGESVTTSSWSGGRQRLIIHSNSNTLFTRYAIDNITLQRSVDLGLDKTVSFNEDVKGWVSFKSFIPEGGLSLSKKYFTFKSGGLWQHNLGSYSDFYGAHVEPHLTAILNTEPSVIKSFRTLNYEGSQAAIVGYGEEVINGDTLSDISFSNLVDKNGWYTDSIITNKQEGFVPDFIEKEGKWFNYIKGTIKSGSLETSYISQHTGDLSFQGIGEISSASFDV